MADSPETQQASAVLSAAAPETAPPPDGEPEASPPAAAPRRGIEFLGGVELDVAVELGRSSLSVAEILELQPGSVVELDAMLGDPASMVVRGRMVAQGEVVVVDDRFGLRITEIVPPPTG